MFWRALLAFVALPGVVAFAVPFAWLAWRGPLEIVHRGGLGVVALGTIGLLWCVRDFYVRGKGTLAPWAPPRTLVVVGLYRFSRNPMYVCVLVVLSGIAWTFASSAIAAYAVVVACGFHLRVVLGEEPWLAAHHGAVWSEYERRVRRWIGWTEGPTS
ncbi:MAG: isoprenylcysteine carboxylmethyltransferase family protein [Planctomycetes bacterium]|nr:isoprenylcysteine carboxylmethyltransferase family protein [Planctomycetota bacterium]